MSPCLHPYVRDLMPLEHLQPATRVQFGLGAVLQHSRTPRGRIRGQGQEQERSALYRILSLRAEALSFGRST
jgi:hypothetical protein